MSLTRWILVVLAAGAVGFAVGRKTSTHAPTRLERPHAPVTTNETRPAEHAPYQPDPAPIATKPPKALAWLRRLDAKRFGDLSADGLRHLRELDLSGRRLDPADLAMLRELPSLAILDLGRTQLTDDGLAALGPLPRLRTLNLRGAMITDDGLASLSGMPRLRDLDLSATSIGDAGIDHLKGHANLRELHLTGTKITDEAILKLGGLPLEALSIGSTAVGDTGMAGLRAFQLAELSIYRNANITDAGFRHLQDQPKLKKLMIRGVNVSADGLAHLRHLNSLEELNASLVVDDAAMGHIAELSSLKRLGLYSNPGISDAGALQLARLKNLEFLQLQFTKVTDETLAALAGLEKLNFLDLRGTQVTTPARDAFAQAHPGCRILR